MTAKTDPQCCNKASLQQAHLLLEAHERLQRHGTDAQSCTLRLGEAGAVISHA